MGGEPYTWRRVSTVRRQAVGNLPPKGGTAPTAEPTNHQRKAQPRHGEPCRKVEREAKRAEGKGVGYDRWAAKHNLKQMAATVTT